MLKTPLFALICAIVICRSWPINAEDLDAGAVDFFEAKVRPLLVAHCYECRRRA